MTAIVERYDTAPAFVSPRHFGGVLPKRMLDRDGYSGPVTVAISVYPPGAGAEDVVQATDVVYVVLGGELRISVDGQVHDLATHDTMFIPEGDSRSVENVSDGDARLLVLRPRG